jgi:hypothetical protein
MRAPSGEGNGVAAAERVREASAVVDAPSDRIDLARWLRGLTSEDYVAFTPRSGAHKSHSTIEDDGELVIESVESIGGTVVRHRYVAEILQPHHTLFVSPDSRGTFLSRIPVRFRTSWELRVADGDGATSRLDCRITVEYRSRLWLFLSALSGTPLWLRLHSREETPRMAASIAADAARQ